MQYFLSKKNYKQIYIKMYEEHPEPSQHHPHITDPTSYFNKSAIKERNYQIALSSQHKSRTILDVLVCYDNSVILVQEGRLLHVSITGKVEYQLEFKGCQVLAEMVRSMESVIVLMIPRQSSKKSQLIQWNLITYQTISIPFEKQLQTTTPKLFIFPNSSQICILQKFVKYYTEDDLVPTQIQGIYSGRSQKYWLTYYTYPFTKKQQKPTHKFGTQLTEEEKSTSYHVTQLNNNSMVGWHSTEALARPYSEVCIYVPGQTFDGEGRPSRKSYRFPNGYCKYQSLCGKRILDVLCGKYGTKCFT